MNNYDLTFDVETDMPTCGTPWHQLVEITPMGKIDTVGRNTSRIVLGSHSGTHMDAPYHFIDDGKTMEKLDINIMKGIVQIVDFRNKRAGDVVTLDDVNKLKITGRMLFAFGWYHNWKTDSYYKSFPYFSQEAIKFLIDGGIKLMAMDTPSPDDGSSIKHIGETDSPNHVSLLKNEVIIVEYLNNTDILDVNKQYEIVALPLKIKGSDGCPARVIVSEI